ALSPAAFWRWLARRGRVWPLAAKPQRIVPRLQSQAPDRRESQEPGNPSFRPRPSAGREQRPPRLARRKLHNYPQCIRRHFAEHGTEESAAPRAALRPGVADEAEDAVASLGRRKEPPDDQASRAVRVVQTVACGPRPY